MRVPMVGHNPKRARSSCAVCDVRKCDVSVCGAAHREAGDALALSGLPRESPGEETTESSVPRQVGSTLWWTCGAEPPAAVSSTGPTSRQVWPQAVGLSSAVSGGGTGV